MVIGIVGNGFVGRATALLGCRDDYADYEDNVVLMYDKDPDRRIPKNLELEDLSRCDIVFVAVPTPMKSDGTCHTDIVESVVRDLRGVGVKDIFIRSTVPVGFSRRLEVNFMPEFLTENNWEEDFKTNKKWVFGLHDTRNKEIKKKLRKIFLTAKHNNKINHMDITYCRTEEAELCKYSRNCFLATKVAFFNEIEEFCRKKGIEYNHVQEIIGCDPRIGMSHTDVPGPDGKRGFGGTCFPKDLSSLYQQMLEVSMESYIVEGAMARNNQVDRPEADWNKNVGRAVI